MHDETLAPGANCFATMLLENSTLEILDLNDNFIDRVNFMIL